MKNTQEINTQNDQKAFLGQAARGFAFWFGVLVYLELLLHLMVFDSVTLKFLYAVGYSALTALVLSVLTGFASRTVNFIIDLVFVCALCIVFGSQMIYYYIFGTLYSVAMVGLGGDAITTFWSTLTGALGAHILGIILMILPVIITILLRKLRGRVFDRSTGRAKLLSLGAAALVYFALLLSLRIGGTGFYSTYSFYHGSDVTTNQAAGTFGLITANRLEIQHMIAGNKTTTIYRSDLDSAQTTASPDAEEKEKIEYNVLNIDFDALSKLTEDETILEINEYCASLTGTNKNDYTGMLSDYNLIVICAESFSYAALNPDVTPTLCKLASEGIVFNNYYNSFPNSTSDGEYALCMGLMPDTSRGKTDSSFYASRNSYIPMSLGNVFRTQFGVQSYFYHNNYNTFYGRNLTHPNIGYSCKFAGSGMSFTSVWPTSDLEMMEQSVDDYIGQEQFHAYYMTFSGHIPYNTGDNPMAARNYAEVSDLDYAYNEQCYLACNLELEKAVEYLMQRLEEEGVADKTAIVIAADHYPYGLDIRQYSDLLGYTPDTGFGMYKSPLIFWVGGLDEPIVVDKYCCNIDILPTILNLWGVQYDSRLLAGRDVFSDATHIAILSDQSFLTDKVWFDSTRNTATYLVDESTLPDGYLESCIQVVKTRFAISTYILNKAYYNFVFGIASVEVGTDGWITQGEWNALFEGGNNEPDEPAPTPSPTPSPALTPSSAPTTAPIITDAPIVTEAPVPTEAPTPTQNTEG